MWEKREKLLVSYSYLSAPITSILTTFDRRTFTENTEINVEQIFTQS